MTKSNPYVHAHYPHNERDELSDKSVFVGQTLYRETYNRDAPGEIKEFVVSKIGKKYFYLIGWENRYPINKESLRYEDKNYTQRSFQLYRNKQEILDRRERADLLNRLKKHFDWSGNSNKNTLEQLRIAADVLGLSEMVGSENVD